MFAQTAVVVANAAATRRARLLTLAVRRGALAFRAGQAIRVRAATNGMAYPYSIASSPESTAETGQLELLVGTSGAGEQLMRQPPGSRLEIEGPVGSFVLPVIPGGTPLLFIAGGCGIAPIRSMIDHLAHRGARHPMSLVYSAREREDFAFTDELDRRVREGRLELWRTATRIASDSGDVQCGRIDAPLLLRALRDPATTVCFVCGPAAFVATCASMLRHVRVPDPQIRTEQAIPIDAIGALARDAVAPPV